MDEGNGFAAEPPNQNKILGWGYLGITVCGFCPDSIFCISLPFITKLGVVVHHHKLECCAFFFFFYSCCPQGHSEGLYDQIITISTISPELEIFLQPN